ncbi:hypothetical protein KC347_g48 [Hortaea werneckii]|nr:hypothetical protein KC347_g48 [Hortaea werneckii]
MPFADSRLFAGGYHRPVPQQSIASRVERSRRSRAGRVLAGFVEIGQRLRFARQRAGKTLYRHDALLYLRRRGNGPEAVYHLEAQTALLCSVLKPPGKRSPPLQVAAAAHTAPYAPVSSVIFCDAIPLPRKRPESPYSIRSKPRSRLWRSPEPLILTVLKLLLLNGIGAGKQRVMMVCNMGPGLLSVRTDIVLIGNSRRHFLGCVSQSGTSGTDGRADSVG